MVILSPSGGRARRTITDSRSREAPLRGWNTRNTPTSMKEGYALVLDNWICRTSGLHVRAGSESLASNLGGAVKTLLPGADKLFAATDTAIFDITAGGSSFSPSLSGITSGNLTCGRLANPGGNILIAANGADGVIAYLSAASSWALAQITGVDATKLKAVCIHQNRAFFIEKGTLNVWYLDLMAFQGPAHKIVVAPMAKKGGELVALGSLAPDGGSGKNNQLFAVTSNGEMIVYSGDNPARSQSWSHSGTYEVPPPVGVKCFCKFGTDLAYLSVDGVMPVTKILPQEKSDYKPTAITDQIRDDVKADIALTADVRDDWMMVEGEDDGLFLTHVPLSSQTYQYCIAPETGGLSAFLDIGATCWASFGRSIYFGRADGTVRKYGGAPDPGDTAINAYMVEALAQYGSGLKKTFNRNRPIFTSGGPFRIGVLTEDQMPPDTFIAPKTRTEGGPWQWHHADWPGMPAPWLLGGTKQRKTQWVSVSGRGYWGALMLGVKTKVPTVYQGNEMGFEIGGDT